MSTTDQAAIIESILHPTDFSAGSLVAFHHALKAALVAKSKLTLLNVSRNGDAQMSDFPGVRETLERWGLLPAGSPRSAVIDLGMRVEKIIADRDDAVKAVLGFLHHRRVDLIVLAASEHKWPGALARKISFPTDCAHRLANDALHSRECKRICVARRWIGEH